VAVEAGAAEPEGDYLMTKQRLFGGTRLSDIASSVKERGESSPFDRSPARPVLPAAEIALTGRKLPALERESIFAVDPRRCRPWKYHNRTESWYTRERCQDLIDSIARDGQQEPALARRVEGDAAVDYELIYGMRRRFACEFNNAKLRIRVVEADDARAAVLMHIENADRKDITPMERAVSFLTQVEAKIFPTQDAMAEAFGVSKGQVAKMIKAAQLLKQGAVAQLFTDRSVVPVEQAYKLQSLMERAGAKEIVLQAAHNLARRGEGRDASAVLRHLLTSLDRSRHFEPLRREYNVGTAGRVIVTRNLRGKVTLAFPKGLRASDVEAARAALDQILRDLG
jgi:ParB/RepB/Spo0J family partition protein